MASIDPSKVYIDKIVSDHFNQSIASKNMWEPYTNELGEFMKKTIDELVWDALKAPGNETATEVQQKIHEPKFTNDELFELKQCIREAIAKNDLPH